jgi:23S rRNA pseudouridine2605 synthase
MKSKGTTARPGIRLNRFIAESGVCSRRAADTLITEGHVTINGKIAVLGMNVSGQDTIAVDGKPLPSRHRNAYLLLNKPKDCITTASDDRGRRTVLEVVNYHDRIFPIGRLDRNSTGVLLLTNDGELAHRLMHPRYGVEKMYHVVLDKAITRAQAHELEKGIVLEGKRTSPCTIELNARDLTELALTMHEGRNRQVRKMFEEIGFRVQKLDRIMYAGLTAKGLKRGAWRQLTHKETGHLKKLAHLTGDE